MTIFNYVIYPTEMLFEDTKETLTYYRLNIDGFVFNFKSLDLAYEFVQQYKKEQLQELINKQTEAK